ncbi:MAG TPA: STAS domain-containing protein [Anaerolineales bacterium]|nr:STAS domain-containing protein [Anaerolineales bacterium]
MSITTNRYFRSDVVKMNGRVDTYTSAALQKTLDEIIGAGRYNIVFDMTGVDFLSSKGLHVLTETQIKAKGKGGKLVLVNANEKIRESFEWVGMVDYFELFDDLTRAVGSF